MLRDPIRPEEYYERAISDARQRIAGARSLNQTVLLIASVPRYLIIARALYSLGRDKETVQSDLANMVDLYLEFLAGQDYRLPGISDVELYNELIGAALLSGKRDELFGAFGRSVLTGPPAGMEACLLDQACRGFGGRGPSGCDQPPGKTRLHKSLSTLPPLLDTIESHDTDAFQKALVDYLLQGWGPSVEKGAKDALRHTYPFYGGRWSIFGAASCRFMEVVPDIPKKAQNYVPIDLI
jgi:hypothetical protein